MFQIGDFSKLCQVSKRLLHHYDEKNILKPNHVDKHSGYRYYSASQIPLLNRILALKELGLSLDQIAQLLAKGVIDEHVRGMLSLKEAELKQSLTEQELQLKKIRTRLQLNKRAESPPDVVMKLLPQQYFIGLRRQYDSPDQLMTMAGLLMAQLGARLKNVKESYFTACVYSETFTLENQDIHMGFSLPTAASARMLAPLNRGEAVAGDFVELQASVLAEVKLAACAVLVGSEDAILTGLNDIARWIDETGYKLAGPYREVIVEIPTSGDFAQAVIEIQVPVTLS